MLSRTAEEEGEVTQSFIDSPGHHCASTKGNGRFLDLPVSMTKPSWEADLGNKQLGR